MEYNDDNEKIIEPDSEGGWVDTHHYDVTSEIQERVLDMTIDSMV